MGISSKLAIIGLLLLAPVGGIEIPNVPADREMPFYTIVDNAGPDDLQVWIVDADVPAALNPHIFPNLGMALVIATENELDALGIEGFANAREELHLDRSVPFIFADKARIIVGNQRTGPSVAVVDTGLDSTHPDFQSGNVAANIQTSPASGIGLEILDSAPVVDQGGHGTHVAGIVAGAAEGQALGGGSDFEGVYSNGRIVSFQAANEVDENGEAVMSVAAIIAGFDWILENQDEFEIRVVNNSWGSSGNLTASHPVTDGTFALYRSGINVVFSAGNEGKAGTLNRHCLPPWVLCVGAVDLDGERASFSSYGRTPGPGIPAFEHPDIMAPGQGITSTEAMVSVPPGTDTYGRRSGTSMAAPHVAGVAGLLVAGNPQLSPDQIMDVLAATARDNGEPAHKSGAGVVDALAAMDLALDTKGNLTKFLAGDQVKYGGPETGDMSYSKDPITVGIAGSAGGQVVAVVPNASGALYFLTSPLAIGASVVGLAFVLLAFRRS